MIVALPNEEDDILGVALHDDTILFATAHNLYTLHQGVALPLVIGLGGPLRFTSDGIYLLAGEGLYRVTTSPTS